MRPASALEHLASEIVSCRRCPRLVAYRESIALLKRRQYCDETYWGRPLPGFGDPRAQLMIVGLAPAAHGGNRTGRMFTGDDSGAWLMRALHRAGFANRPTSTARDDGLRLRDAYITAAVRCAPPENRPTVGELVACRRYLGRERALLPGVRVIVALGRVAFDAVLAIERERGVELSRPLPRFAHGAAISLEDVTVIASYHPSRQNTQTRRLTVAMLDGVFRRARAALDGKGSPERRLAPIEKGN